MFSFTSVFVRSFAFFIIHVPHLFSVFVVFPSPTFLLLSPFSLEQAQEAADVLGPRDHHRRGEQREAEALAEWHVHASPPVSVRARYDGNLESLFVLSCFVCFPVFYFEF
jgi:hypothetical protein